MYCILSYTRIKPRSRPPQKNSAYFTHPDFSEAKIEKKVRKLREQIRYFNFIHDYTVAFIFFRWWIRKKILLYVWVSEVPYEFLSLCCRLSSSFQSDWKQMQLRVVFFGFRGEVSLKEYLHVKTVTIKLPHKI